MSASEGHEAGTAAAVEGLPTAEDLVLVGDGCSLACPFCMYGRGRAGSRLAEVLDPAFRLPLATRVTLFAGDVVRPELAPVVRRLRAAGSDEVLVYAHPGVRDVGPLKTLAEAGLTGVYLMLPAASKDLLHRLTGGLGTLARAAGVIDAANALGLAVALELPVVAGSFAALPDTLARALHRIARPDRVVARFLSEFDRVRGPVGWDPGLARDALAATIRVADARRVPLHLAHPQAPPPCLLDLPDARPENYPGFMIAGWARERPRPYDACAACAVATVCAPDARHLAPRGEVQGVVRRPSSVVGERTDLPAGAACPPDDARRTTDDDLSPTTATLYLRQDTLGAMLDELKRRPVRTCRFPWEELEAHDIRGTVTPCAGGWPLRETVDRCASWRDGSLLEAWDSDGMQDIRRAVAAGRAFDTCKRECPAFHGGPQTAVPPIPAPRSRRFFDNVVLNLREMLDGAEVLRSRPQTISFSPTLRCTNRCRMCDIHDVRRVLGDGPELRDMTEGLYRELLDLLPTTRMLALTGGEPLVSSRMRDLLRAFDADRHPDGACTVTTNGLLLRPPLVRDLSRTRIRVFYVSLNAATEATYERVTGTPKGFRRVLDNVRGLLDAAPGMAGRPKVVLSFVVMRSTWREVPAFLALAAGLGTGVRLLPIERDRWGESFFTDEASLREVVAFVDGEVAPVAARLPWSYGAEVAKLSSILRSRLERGDFTAL